MVYGSLGIDSLGTRINMDLDLDDYITEPFSIYATGESWECFKYRGQTASLKLFTVTAHTTLSSRWFQSMIVFAKYEFLDNSDLHCTVLKHLLFLSMIFWVSQSSNKKASQN